MMMDEREKAIRFVIRRIAGKGSASDREIDVERIKLEAARRFGIGTMLRNSEIIAKLGERNRKRLLPLLLKRPMRTLSGVSPIAVMIKPEGSCPYSCIYCPTGLGAKSYTGFEPAALRARQEDFDPYGQVRNRLRHYEETGHETSKCEMILMGGTFLRMPAGYRRSFVKGIYDGLNGKRSRTIANSQKTNEHAAHRAIGLTLETRPDVCGKKEIDEMLSFGATRVELGVQHPNDGIYARINRGHKVADVVKATALLKDSAFKVCYHIMPGLPGSDKRKDIAMVRRLFADERFRPDMLKIYPTLVMPGTKLHRMMERGGYEPYSSEEAADVISEFYRHIPGYVRVMRIQRDIPAKLIGAGVVKSNLRQLVDEERKRKKIKSHEIRSREIGQAGGNERTGSEDLFLKSMEYEASGGKEFFLSFENRNGLIAGFLRLRIPNTPLRKEINGRTALVRELHVYGQEAGLGEREAGKVQHMGIGSKLLEEAERMADRRFGMKKMIIISGVGAREYYRKRGYRLDGPYMSAKL